jgi:hypothetical protein
VATTLDDVLGPVRTLMGKYGTNVPYSVTQPFDPPLLALPEEPELLEELELLAAPPDEKLPQAVPFSRHTIYRS